MKAGPSSVLALTAALCLCGASARAANAVTYRAVLHPMNVSVTGGQTSGEARFAVSGDTLTIDIDVKGAPPGMVHWQHFHGFKDNRDAACPAAMDVAHGMYPKASADGAYHYHTTVSLKALKAAFAKAFGDRDLDLDRRVVFIHGVPDSHKLPASVASLGPIPAQVTLPIACGKIERAAK